MNSIIFGRRTGRRSLVTGLLVCAILTPGSVGAGSPVDGVAIGGASKTTTTVLPDGRIQISAPLVSVASAPDATVRREFSPAGCRITYVDNPHFAASVPGAVKVNAKVQCRTRVESLSLGANLTNVTTGRRAAGPMNVTKDDVMSVENFSTFVRCTDDRSFQFQGNAGAVSIEGGRPYANLAFGNVSRPLACGHDGA